MLSRMPMIREDTLDQALIAHLDMQAPEVAPHSGWIIYVQTHFLGGGRHVGVWEIADIGVFVVLRQAGTVLWSKAVILQSKRLFPLNVNHDEDEERSCFRWGFGRLYGSYTSLAGKRTFDFSDQSCYEYIGSIEPTDSANCVLSRRDCSSALHAVQPGRDTLVTYSTLELLSAVADHCRGLSRRSLA